MKSFDIWIDMTRIRGGTFKTRQRLTMSVCRKDKK